MQRWLEQGGTNPAEQVKRKRLKGLLDAKWAGAHGQQSARPPAFRDQGKRLIRYETLDGGPRVAEPHVYFLQGGVPVLLVYQVGGEPQPERWRELETPDILTWRRWTASSPGRGRCLRIPTPTAEAEADVASVAVEDLPGREYLFRSSHDFTAAR